MKFFNRERDIRRFKAVLSGEPNLVYFVYGPINSGKTALLMKVFEELPEEYRVFYVNFRGVETRKYEDFVEAMFTVKEEGLWERIRDQADILASGLKFAEEVARKLNFGIVLPDEVIGSFRGERGRRRDCFRYLEELMGRLRDKGRIPVLVLDELQMLREVEKNGPVLHDLFNFLVRLTKERHLCHCLCATSDCLFIEEIYSNARLEGRARYILVDDLGKEEAFRVYDEFGFEEKELIWDYIGGKLGDMVALFEEKKQGISEPEGLKKLLKDEVGRLKWIRRSLKEGFKEGPSWEEVEEILKMFLDRWKVPEEELEGAGWLYLVRENILFYDPVEGLVRPQGRLIQKAIREVLES